MILVHSDLDALNRAAAEMFVSTAQRSITDRGRFAVVLSGGTTPKHLYEMLALAPFREKVEWNQVHVFWSDERCVPPADSRSNYHMAREAFLNHVPLREQHIHRVKGELPAMMAAAEYQAELEHFFGRSDPRFDLVLLGLGEDGHTASLFPGNDFALEDAIWAVAVPPPAPGPERVSLTLPILNQAAHVAFIVSGPAKASIVARVLTVSSRPTLPAQMIAPRSGELRWMLDREAAAELDADRISNV